MGGLPATQGNILLGIHGCWCNTAGPGLLAREHGGEPFVHPLLGLHETPRPPSPAPPGSSGERGVLLPEVLDYEGVETCCGTDCARVYS
jgi:hypothetical protein